MWCAFSVKGLYYLLPVFQAGWEFTSGQTSLRIWFTGNVCHNCCNHASGPFKINTVFWWCPAELIKLPVNKVRDNLDYYSSILFYLFTHKFNHIIFVGSFWRLPPSNSITKLISCDGDKAIIAGVFGAISFTTTLHTVHIEQQTPYVGTKKHYVNHSVQGWTPRAFCLCYFWSRIPDLLDSCWG